MGGWGDWVPDSFTLIAFMESFRLPPKKDLDSSEFSAKN